MKNYILFAIIIFSIREEVLCQNIVPNPSFEECQKCDNTGFKELYIDEGANVPIDWTAVTAGTPDFRSNVPRTGKRHGGFFLGVPKYEYLTTHLTETMKAGYTYRCSFSVRPDERGNYYALDEIGVYFHTGLARYQQAEPLKQLKPHYQTPDGEFISELKYKTYSFDYIACGGEDHIIIGMFDPIGLGDTLYIAKNRSQGVVSYYYVDDVSVEQIGNKAIDVLADKIEVCPGTSHKIIIADSIAITDIKWSNGSTGREYTITNETSIWVEYKYAAHCPSVREVMEIVSPKAPIINITGDSILCPNKLLYLTAICTNCNGLLWNTNETNASILADNPGTYTVVGKWQCGEVTASKKVMDRIFEEVKFKNLKTDICQGQSFTVEVELIKGSCNTIKWLDGYPSTYTRKIDTPGVYVFDLECLCRTERFGFEVLPCTTDDILEFPNVFAPSSAIAENKTFGPKINNSLNKNIKAYQLKIYNRWGNKIFETNDFATRFNPDQDEIAQTYIYIAELEVLVGTKTIKQKYKGDVTLLK